MDVGVNVVGAGAFKSALNSLGRRMHQATKRAMADNLRESREYAELMLMRYSHPRGTPTPSRRGEPPAWITGHLHDSLSPTGPRDGAGGVTWQLGPTAVYGRIQELGGVCGAGHRTVLPPRPYMRPTYDQLRGDGTWRRILIDAWRQAL